MKSQQDLARDGLHCAEKLQEFTQKRSLQLGSMTPDQIETFASKTVNPDRCRQFVTNYIPDLQDRFETMRLFLAIGTDQVESSEIETDASALSAAVAPYFLTVWRKDGAKFLAPLSKTRRGELTDLKSLDAGEREAALKRSYDVLSTAPILSTFSDTPNPKSIAFFGDGPDFVLTIYSRIHPSFIASLFAADLVADLTRAHFVDFRLGTWCSVRELSREYACDDQYDVGRDTYR